MRNEVKREARKAWARPTLQRMDAGSAESNPTGTKSDGGVGGGNKS